MEYGSEERKITKDYGECTAFSKTNGEREASKERLISDQFN